MQNEEIPQEPAPQASPPDQPAGHPVLPPRADAPAQAAARDEVRPARGSTVRRVLINLLKVVVFLVALVVVVAALLVGWYQLYTQYLRPGQDNIARVNLLETSQRSSQEQVLTLQAQLPILAEAQAGQAATAAQRVDMLESTLADQSRAQATVQAQLTALAPRVSALESSIAKHNQALAALEATQASLLAGDASRRSALERQVSLLKSMELLSRARLFLFQSNFGLAKEDVQSARDLLAGLPPSSDRAIDQSLAEVVQRLDMVLARLPDFPVVASGDLDIAWQILLSGAVPPTATPLPAAASESTPTPTPTATP